MGKNRPPKKVRELLVELEKSRSELQVLQEKDVTDVKLRLEQLILCKPQDYDHFEVEAQKLLQECAEVCASTKLSNSDDGFWEEEPSGPSKDEDAWKNVCEVRANMHTNLREEKEKEHVESKATEQDRPEKQPKKEKKKENVQSKATEKDKSEKEKDPSQNEGVVGRWRRTKQDKSDQIDANQTERIVHARSNRWIPIVPEVSLTFADRASAGQRQHACPTLPSYASVKPAAGTRAKQQRDGIVLWIRHFDLRINDNPGLVYAASLGQPIHLVFVWSEEEDVAQGKWRIGGTAASLWIYHALAALNADYQRWYGLRINFILGESTVAALQRVVKETGATKIVTSKAFDNAGRSTEQHVKRALHAANVKFECFNSFLLNDVDSIRIDLSENRGHFGTLVPFLFACKAQPSPPKPQGAPAALPKTEPVSIPGDVGLQGLGLCRFPIRCDGSLLDWGAPIIKEWNITEKGAYAALQAFLKKGGGLSRYETERHLADASAVARISPYMRFGMLSCRTVFWEANAVNAKDIATTFWRRLVWRDLAYWQLRLFPSMVDKPIRDHYAGQKWNSSKDALRRWCQGRTGFPIVDAGLRELWATGWMTQNVRMVAAIVLVEHLNINWVEGAQWFHHTLVDADPAINPMMWQNAGKSGLDQWNFTMHPAEVGRRMDPTGDYVRRWCPELAPLPARFIHCPWEAPERLQKHLVSGTYPKRLIEDLEAAASTSRSAIREQRARRRDRNDDSGYDMIVLPNGSTLAHDGRRARLFTKKEYRLPVRATVHDDDRVGYKYQPEKRRPDDFQITLGDYIRAQD